MDYFVARSLRTSSRGGIVSGNFLVGSDAGPHAARTAHAKPRGKREVTWILPPPSNAAYDDIKWLARSAGYETVEHDDFASGAPPT